MFYVEVILPLKLGWNPVYSAPEGIPVGRRVRVLFARREYIGVVSAAGVTPDVAPEKVQEVLEVVDGLPDVTEDEIRFWKFISSYYLCSVGEVFKAAYPAGKVRSERLAAAAVEKAAESRKHTVEAAIATWTKRISKLEYRLRKKQETIAGKREGTKIHGLLKEDIAKIESQIRSAREALEALRGQKADEEAVLEEVPKAGCSPAVKARPAASKPEVLVGTGRAVRYAESVRKALDGGFQVLVLAPEKALCDKLARELGDCGAEVHLFTSDITAVRRRKIADAVRSGEAKLVVGTRAALWLPYKELGLVIIDEEQDTFYKQTEPAPRYNGRDAAVALAGIHSAGVILGSTVPSLETMLNMVSGKYRASCPLPQEPVRPEENVRIVDISKERRKNGMVEAFSRILIRAVSDTAGKVIFVRGWEKADELQEQADRLFPGRDIAVMTLQELKRNGAEGAGLIAVIQADALVSRDDFRADERAVQLVSELAVMAPEVLVQTAVGERFSGSRSTEELMAERKQFGFPPYTRMVDITMKDGNAARLDLMGDRFGRAIGSSPVPVGDDGLKFRIVLQRNSALAASKAKLYKTVCDFEQAQKYTGHIIIDVDPR